MHADSARPAWRLPLGEAWVASANESIVSGSVRRAVDAAKGIQIWILLPDVFDSMGKTSGELWAGPLFDDRQRHIDPRGHTG